MALSRNDVRIPGDDGTRFDMIDLLGSDAAPVQRLELTWQLNERHALRAVAAPLRVKGRGELTEVTEFAGETFAAAATEGTYQFNAYKFTWRYAFDSDDRWRWGVGLTGLIRDAEIALTQGDVQASDDNVGFVPALHFSGEYRLTARWLAGIDLDALAGGPGRLIDLGLSVNYRLGEYWRLGVRLRVLEGGADTDAVYNFAQLNYGLLSVGYWGW